MSEEKRYTIEVTEHQLRLIANCIEDLHRFAAGDTLLFFTCQIFEEWKKLRKELKNLKPLVTPHLQSGQEYDWCGNCCEHEPQRKFIAETYALYREIMHILNKNKCNVYSNPTLTCEEGGELPIIKIVK